MAEQFIPHCLLMRKVHQHRNAQCQKQDANERQARAIQPPTTVSTCVYDTTRNIASTTNISLDHVTVHSANEQPLPTDMVEDDEPVKEYAYYQRAALLDEPTCVICGRYGEYVSDTTEHDVCSLECKRIDVERGSAGDAMLVSDEDAKLSIGRPASNIYRPIDRFHAHLLAYQTHASMACLTADEVEAIRTQRHIKARGRQVPPLLAEFAHLELPDTLRANLQSAGFYDLTPVQMQVIPAALAARDLIAAAPTGSGKTLSFLLPCVMHAYALSNALQHSGRPYVFVVAPSHDLCAQLETKARALCRGMPEMRTALITGAIPIATQLHRVRKGVAMVFGTPGRLTRVINQLFNHVDRPRADIIVLDEVDRLLQSEHHQVQLQQLLRTLTGLDGTSRRAIPATSHPHQLMLFSATRAWRARRVLKHWLRDPVRIAVGNLDLVSPDVRQVFLWVENNSKKRRLFLLLNDPERYPLPAVVFVQSRIGAELLAEAIEKRCPGLRARCIHGELPVDARNAALADIQSGYVNVIVATGGLWSRGIDIERVRLVINFDMPTNVDEYVHQVGRAGRAGNTGQAISMVNDGDASLFHEMLEMLRLVPAALVAPLPVAMRRYHPAYTASATHADIASRNASRVAFTIVSEQPTQLSKKQPRKRTLDQSASLPRRKQRKPSLPS